MSVSTWQLNDVRADFAEILVPLSQSPDISAAQKKQMIGKFLEVTASLKVLLSVLETDGILCGLCRRIGHPGTLERCENERGQV